MRPATQTLGQVSPGSPGMGARAWITAIRPKTLSAGAMPVLLGIALAYRDGAGRALPALAALFGALLIQIGTNLANDYYDFKKGADTAERVGPLRVTQGGLIPPSSVLAGALMCFGAAALVGLYLVSLGGWPIVAIGLLSLLAGFAYTGGPVPLGYVGLGDLFVFVFFGLFAVAGTYYVQAGRLSPSVWWAAIAAGSLGTAILVVNNLRDVVTDARAGKKTLVVRWGIRAARAEYCSLLAAAFLAPVALWVTGLRGPGALLSLLSLPLTRSPLRRVFSASGADLNPALGETARLQIVFGLLFALGLWVT